MEITFCTKVPDFTALDALVLGGFSDINSQDMYRSLGQEITELLAVLPQKDNRYDKGEWEHYTLFFAGNIRHVLLYGQGKATLCQPDDLRKAAGHCARLLNNLKVTTACLALSLPPALPAEPFVQAIAEGAPLGLYHFSNYKEKAASRTVKQLCIQCDPTVDATRIGQQADCIVRHVVLARDMVNHPAIHLTPTKMAEMALQLHDAQPALLVEIMDIQEAKDKGLSAFAAVAQGSAEPAKLIIMKYHGNTDSKKLLGLIGKGITFDSGGISLKPSESMGEMKGDMAGGAAVIAAIGAIAELKLPVNVLGIIPCAENMPSGAALRPGDVIDSLAGKTIEIISTDAEGRLILADALTLAKQAGVTHLVDVATLTGACMVALGTVTSGMVSNHREWCDAVLAAGARSGEKLWEMPNDPEYKELIKSDIADLKNSGGRWGGMITAGLFLGEFAGETPWVHIDIAGTADTDKEQGYNPKGATGAMVRMLVDLAGQG